MSDLIKSQLGYEYDLKDALRHNPTIIMAGDDICAVALRHIEELEAENARLRDALSEYVYETTHLSPTENDGSHWCKIPSECLRKARAALEEKKDD